MARIVHIALKVENLEHATRFYEEALGMHQVGTGYARGHLSRHMSDGAIDLALMVYDDEYVPEARLSGAGPCIHHFGIEVEDRDATAQAIVNSGGTIISDPDEGALKFRAPDGVVAEITRLGRYRKHVPSECCRIVRLTIQSNDIGSSARFYETVFGFKTASGNDRALRLTDGAFDLELVKAADNLPAKHHHLGIRLFNLDTCSLTRDGASSLPGYDTAFFHAPDDTLIEIL